MVILALVSTRRKGAERIMERKEYDFVQRDGLVEKLLLEADIPLVRLRNIDTLTDEDIDRVFRDAHERREI